MSKNVLWLGFKHVMITAHGHTVSADDVWTDDDDAITKFVGHQSHLATGATHTPTAPKAVSADHGAATMHGRRYRYAPRSL